MDYDYRKAVKEDVEEYIQQQYLIDRRNFADVDEFRQKAYDDMFISDSVTGNASGSYTFNTYKAEEYLCHNWDLLEEALTEFNCDSAVAIERGAEYCDVTIRCYLLGEVLDEVIEEMDIEEMISNKEAQQ